MRFIFLVIILSFHVIGAQNSEPANPRWALSINALQTPAFIAAKYLVNWPVTFVPIHTDASYSLNDSWGIAFGLVYRYENYYGKNPLNKNSIHQLWINYHELFLMTGPRYSFSGEGNRGLYAAFKLGPGLAMSPGGYAISAVGQPELGFSFIFGQKIAFHLDLAAGLMLNMPLVENPKLGFSLSPIGWLVHRTVPLLKVGLGIAF